jgi:sarcosine oxidase
MERADVVVIGLGAMGSAATLSLARRGVETVVLEQFEVGHARGSSHGPTRIFRLSYPHPDYVRMAERALPLWRELEEAGAACEWLSAREAAERFPSISFEGLDRVLYQPDAGVALADRTVAAQERLARGGGAEIREEARVTGIEPNEDGVVVHVGTGSIRARRAVVTAGGWTQSLLDGAGYSVPVRSTVQTVSYLRPRTDAPMPTLIEWSGESLAWYAVPQVGGAPGAKVAEHRPGPLVDPARAPFPPDEHAEKANGAYAARRLPGFDPWPVASETCLYELTPDEDFVIDQIGPIVVGAGFSGHGFKFVPLIGELLADLAQDQDLDIPRGRFSLRRF